MDDTPGVVDYEEERLIHKIQRMVQRNGYNTQNQRYKGAMRALLCMTLVNEMIFFATILAWVIDTQILHETAKEGSHKVFVYAMPHVIHVLICLTHIGMYIPITLHRVQFRPKLVHRLCIIEQMVMLLVVGCFVESMPGYYSLLALFLSHWRAIELLVHRFTNRQLTPLFVTQPHLLYKLFPV
jgi:hypothetical protein